MRILNYSTTVGAERTVTQIEKILAIHGAKAILKNLDGQGEIEALSFKVQTPNGEMGIRLPVDRESTLRVMLRQPIPRKYMNRKHASRVAWRIIKDWVEAQMAVLETEMVRIEQIFLPYVVMKDGRTLFQTMVDSQFQLQDGAEPQE